MAGIFRVGRIKRDSCCEFLNSQRIESVNDLELYLLPAASTAALLHCGE